MRDNDNPPTRDPDPEWASVRGAPARPRAASERAEGEPVPAGEGEALPLTRAEGEPVPAGEGEGALA